MKPRFLFLALLTAFLNLALHYPPAQASPGEDLAQAAALLEKGQAGPAYEIYSRLWRENPSDEAATLGLARSATRAKRWNQAVMAYESLLEKYPGAAGLYGELAQAQMLLGDRAGAERSLAVMRALDGQITRDETDQALEAMEKQFGDFQVRGKIRFGALYDSNVNQGPSSDVMDLGSWRVEVPNAKAKESFGAYFGADFDFSRRFYRDSAWHLVSDVRFNWRGLASSNLAESRTREYQWGRAALGLRHLSDDTLAEFRLKAEIFDYEFFQQVVAGGLEGTWVRAARPDFHLILRGGLDRLAYSQDSSRNGPYGWLGGYGRFFFTPERHEFLLGGRYLGASTNQSAYGYHGWEGSAGFTFKLPHGFEVSPFFIYTEQHYRGPATALEAADRWDERVKSGLGLTYRLTESWSVESGYTYTNNRSNSALYTYDQHSVNLGMAWEF